jgi:5-methylcytosine-specific restriction endonuclease McrA
MDSKEKAKARVAAWNARNPGLSAARAKAWYVANKERAKARIIAWQKANPEKRAAHVRIDNAKRAEIKQAWRLANPECDQRYYEKNRDKYIANAQARYRRVHVDQRCTCCEVEMFAKVFAIAKSMAAEVDHIKPLALGGLHCCKNLQVLTKAEHRKKTIDDMRAIRRCRRDNSPRKSGEMLISEKV